MPCSAHSYRSLWCHETAKKMACMQACVVASAYLPMRRSLSADYPCCGHSQIARATASAIVASVQDVSAFPGAREFAAFLGLTRRQNSSGGKERLGPASKLGNRYLRKPLVVRAYVVLLPPSMVQPGGADAPKGTRDAGRAVQAAGQRCEERQQILASQALERRTDPKHRSRGPGRRAWPDRGRPWRRRS